MQDGTFDHIVVGAGSAGCVVASRLAAEGRRRVLLLEAGPKDTNPWIHVPLGYGKTMFNPRLNWMFQTEPEPLLNGRRVKQPRGRVLGGSSSINGLVYVRGQREDYDRWRDLGCPGWSYADVLPFFRMSEDQQRGANDWHGAGGPLAVSDFTDGTHPVAEAFLEAAASLGMPRNADFNGATQEGVGYYQATARNGLRCSTAAFLAPAKRRGNLEVRTNALALRVIFKDGRAAGVEYRCGGATRTSYARGDIVLSAGAIQSPQLLELSGIGQGALLQQTGVPVVHDAPGVGEHLHDHLQSRLIFRTREPITVNDVLQSFPRKAAMVLNYALARRGPLSWLAAIAGGFVRTDPALERPDIQFQLYPYSSDRVDPALHDFSAFTLTVCKLRPESRGSVHIGSPDPARAPLIRLNYLSVSSDIETTLAGVKLGRRVAQSPAMQRIIAAEYDPGPACTGDADTLEFIRAKAFSVYHPVGSCRMGTDAASPVDARLLVKGVSGLRIADCSAMPLICSGNTNAAAIMIGERAADFILREAT